MGPIPTLLLQMALGDLVEMVAARSGPTNIQPMYGYMERTIYEQPLYAELASRNGSSVMVLHGRPGLGKRWLAHAMGYRALEAGCFPGGLLFLDCTGLVSTAALLRSILSLTGMALESTRPTFVAAVLKERTDTAGSMCLVLVGIESVMTADGARFREALTLLKDTAPALKLLMTSIVEPKFDFGWRREMRPPTLLESYRWLRIWHPGTEEALDQILAQTQFESAKQIRLLASKLSKMSASRAPPGQELASVVAALPLRQQVMLCSLSAVVGSFSEEVAQHVGGADRCDLRTFVTEGLLDLMAGRYSMNPVVASGLRGLSVCTVELIASAEVAFQHCIMSQVKSIVVMFDQEFHTTAMSALCEEVSSHPALPATHLL